MEQQTVTLIVGLGGVIVGGLITWVTNLLTNRQRFKHELEMREKRLQHEEKERGLKLKQEKISKAYELIGKLRENINQFTGLFHKDEKNFKKIIYTFDEIDTNSNLLDNVSHPYILEMSKKTQSVLEKKDGLLFYLIKTLSIHDKGENIDELAVSVIASLESLEWSIEEAEDELDNLVVASNIVPTAPEFKRKVESHTEQPSS